MLKAMALSVPLIFSTLPASAQGASIACYYMIITLDHDDAVACGAPLDSAHEANCTAIHSALESFIRANARTDADALLSALKRSASHKPGTPREEVCDKFQARRKFLELETSSEVVAMVQAGMKKTPGDPMVGGCI